MVDENDSNYIKIYAKPVKKKHGKYESSLEYYIDVEGNDPDRVASCASVLAREISDWSDD
ncbi:MAG: hypothetical protein DRP15_02205 [Candidatus Aenigmatarchaeota archaeon]|nr:MAG: hypothetical protein DRP15_02205 [Candidatus Aenigmarchaeota archaeon]